MIKMGPYGWPMKTQNWREKEGAEAGQWNPCPGKGNFSLYGEMMKSVPATCVPKDPRLQ
jgi:hypothetical protein